jgi:hypothetical protein
MAACPSGKGTACKAAHIGSNPVAASKTGNMAKKESDIIEEIAQQLKLYAIELLQPLAQTIQQQRIRIEELEDQLEQAHDEGKNWRLK